MSIEMPCIVHVNASSTYKLSTSEIIIRCVTNKWFIQGRIFHGLFNPADFESDPFVRTKRVRRNALYNFDSVARDTSKESK